MTDANFDTDLDHLYALMNQAVPRGVVLSGSVEGQAANAADVPWMRGQFMVQYRDRCAEILAEWPEKIM